VALSHELISQFAKLVVQDKKTNAETTVYGTIVVDGEDKYVQIDGSDQWVPIEDGTIAVDANAGERVSVLIKNHTATVTGNVSSPAARTGDVKDLGDRVTEVERFDLVLADRVEANEAYIEKLQADEAEFGTLEAATARITELESRDVKITGRLDASEATIENLKTTKLDATAADVKFATIESLDATVADIAQLEANKASIEDLEAAEADIAKLNAEKASIKDLEATEAKIDNLDSTFATIENLEATDAKINNLEAADAKINGTLSAHNAVITNLDSKYANIDFSNIKMAAIEKLFSDSGIIKDLIVSDEKITGELVGVTLKGDLVEAGTLKADRLVVKGSDGNYYALNTDFEAMPGVTPVEEDAIHGSVLIKKSIVAEKIAVDDLVAFGATIGGFKITGGGETYEKGEFVVGGDMAFEHPNPSKYTEDTFLKVIQVDPDSDTIYFDNGDLWQGSGEFTGGAEGSVVTEFPVGSWACLGPGDEYEIALHRVNKNGSTTGAIHSVVKDSVNNTTRGFYVDNDGQMAVGDSNNFLKYFKDSDGKYKLIVAADVITFGTEQKSVEETIDEIAESTSKAQNDADALKTRVTSAETRITQNEKDIALRATKQEVTNTLGGYYTKTESDANLKVSADSVKTEVSKTYATKKEVSDIEIGGRNLLYNSSFKESLDQWETEGDSFDTQKTISGTGVIAVNNALEGESASVQFVGDIKGKNLFDVGSESDYDAVVWVGGIENGSISIRNADSNAAYIINTLNRFASGQYTVSSTALNGRARYLVRAFDSSGNILSNSSVSISGLAYNSHYKAWYVDTTPCTFTIPNTVDHWCLGFSPLASVGESVTISDIQLEKAPSATSYVPFGRGSVEVYNKNLIYEYTWTKWSGNGFTMTANKETGAILINGPGSPYQTVRSLRSNMWLPVGTYTLSINADKQDVSAYIFAANPSYSVYHTATALGPKTFTVDTPELYSFFININPNTPVDNLTIRPMLRVGSMPSGYEKGLPLTTYVADENGLVTIPDLPSPNATVITDVSNNMELTYVPPHSDFITKYDRSCFNIKHPDLKTSTLKQDVTDRLDPDTEYTLSGWFLTENVDPNGSVALDIVCRNEDAVVHRLDKALSINAGSGSWEFVSWALQFTTDMIETGILEFGISASDLVGDVYFYDLKLEKGNRVTDWTPAPEDTDRAIVESVGEVQLKLLDVSASIETTSEAITMKALESYVTLEDHDADIETAKAQLRVEANGIQMDFEKTINDKVDGVDGKLSEEIASREKHITFGEDGIIITAGPNSVKVRIDNDEIRFTVGEGENERVLGSWDGDNFYAGNIVIRTEERAQFGNFAAVPRSNGNLSWLKVN
jgi:hypothetical protein